MNFESLEWWVLSVLRTLCRSWRVREICPFRKRNQVNLALALLRRRKVRLEVELMVPNEDEKNEVKQLHMRSKPRSKP